jgi:hypothetical protein
MMVIGATKQWGNYDDGKDDNYEVDNRVTLHDVTISHVIGRWGQTRDDNGSGQEAAMANKRRWWWWTWIGDRLGGWQEAMADKRDGCGGRDVMVVVDKRQWFGGSGRRQATGGTGRQRAALVGFVVLEFPYVFSLKKKQGWIHQQRKNNDDVRRGRGGYGKCDCLATHPMQANDEQRLG